MPGHRGTADQDGCDDAISRLMRAQGSAESLPVAPPRPIPQAVAGPSVGATPQGPLPIVMSYQRDPTLRSVGLAVRRATMVEPPSRITALSTVDNAAIVQIKEERMAVFPVDLLMLALRFFP